MQESNSNKACIDPGADEYKKKGNEAFKEQRWDDAIDHYNKAISLAPKQPALYSNRAACWSSKGDHASALSDANMCLQQDPSFIKGYSRKGKALFDMKKWDEAESAYRKGLEVDPANDSCLQGLQNAEAARRQERQRRETSENQSNRSFFDPGSLLSFLLKKFLNLFSLETGGRFAGFLFIFALSWAFTTAKTKDMQGVQDSLQDGFYKVVEFLSPSNATETASASSVQKVKREFKQVRGSWLSYLESEHQGETLLLMLHRTARSAEGEFGEIFPEVLAKADSDPRPGGLWLLAPDRPCHGYTACPTGKGEGVGRNIDWLRGLVRLGPFVEQVVVLASGREAAQQAFAFVRKRQQAAKLVIISPSSAAPRPVLGSGLQFSGWLKAKASDMNIRAVADTASWTAAIEQTSKDFSDRALSNIELPRGSFVTLFYLKGDREVNDVTDDLRLETHGVTLKARYSKSRDEVTIAEEIRDEIWELMGSEEKQEEEEPVEEFDDTL